MSIRQWAANFSCFPLKAIGFFTVDPLLTKKIQSIGSAKTMNEINFCSTKAICLMDV
jgi:hypothetical protein